MTPHHEPMAHRPSMEEMQVRDFARDYLRGRRERGETFEAIAKDLGLSKPSIVQAVNLGTKLGPRMIDAVARKAFGGSIDRLRHAAKQRWDALPPTQRLASTAPINPELGAAVAYLRGTMPDSFIDGWLSAQSSHGWTGMTRDDFVTLIRSAYLQKRVSATKDLETARELHRKKSRPSD